MILIDANLLIYAVDRDSSRHTMARKWFEAALSGETEVGLAWVVILAFFTDHHPSVHYAEAVNTRSGNRLH